MGQFVLKFKIVIIAVLGLLFPVVIFAQINNEQICSPVGYSVFTINGIFTNEEEAKKNRTELEKITPTIFNNQPLTVDYLHNPSHIAGLGDLTMSFYQKIFDYEAVEDYDLVEMIKDASEKVKTQKILLVAHSQGNFYANSFYDTVAGKIGGIPNESIGVYAVATPAGRVAGGGKWLTSDTDKVIVDLVGLFPFKKIMTPNTSIVLTKGDDFKGHNFSGVYLKYRGKEIISDIRETLGRLAENNVQSKESPCLAPPKLTLAHKIQGEILSAVDPFANMTIDGIVIVAVEAYQAGKALAKGVASLSGLIAGAYDSILAEDNKNINNEAVALNAIKSENISSLSAEEAGLPALPTGQSGEEAVLSINENPMSRSRLDIAEEALNVLQNQTLSLKNQASFSSESIAISRLNLDIAHKRVVPAEPRLVFTGLTYPGFGGGGDGAQMQTQTVVAEQNNEETTQEAETLSAPVLSVVQCAHSLAPDGCLLANTTVIFSWAAVSGAMRYDISKNGEYSTTTDLSFNANIADFSDYDFSVSAISNATTSATSTQTVSVATIPIAINEIAWMGTGASAYDEWMELKNNTKYRIDLSQWAIESVDGAPFIALAGEMTPYEYRVLERRADTITASSTVSVYGNGSAHWALGNGGEEIVLSYASTTFDRTPAVSGVGWAAGDNAASTTRKTMERISPKISGDDASNWATWGTNVSFIKNGRDANGIAALGTPGECNSASYESINNGQNATSSLTLLADNCYYVAGGEMSISASSTLTVEEGVRISLYQNNLVVNGIIIASGTPDNPIIIDSFSESPTDNRVKISGTAGTSALNNIIVSNTNGIYLNNGASLDMTDTEFANNKYGIELNNGSSANIENASFASTTNEAISAYNGSSITVASSTITSTIDANAIGVYNSTLSVSSTTIDGVLDGDGVGAYNSTVSIASSTINNVLNGDAIGLYNSTTTIDNVAIGNIPNDEGVYVDGGSISGNATIDGAEIEW